MSSMGQNKQYVHSISKKGTEKLSKLELHET